eukprot:g1487.t1
MDSPLCDPLPAIQFTQDEFWYNATKARPNGSVVWTGRRTGDLWDEADWYDPEDPVWAADFAPMTEEEIEPFDPRYAQIDPEASPVWWDMKKKDFVRGDQCFYSEASLRTISRYPIATIEKFMGSKTEHVPPWQYDEDMMIKTLQDLRALNPNQTSIFYMNAWKQEGGKMGRMAEQYAAHPEWHLRSEDGTDLQAYDQSLPEVRKWWVETCVNATNRIKGAETETASVGAVGCYCDASNTYPVDPTSSKTPNDGGIMFAGLSPAKAAAWTEGILNLTREAQEALGPNGFLMGKTANQPFVNAVQIEGFSANNKSITELRKGVDGGKLMECHIGLGGKSGGAAHPGCGINTNATAMEDLLAAFLIGCGPWSYMGCGKWQTDGEDADPMALINQHWVTAPLGPPLGRAVLGSDQVWRRSFASGTNVSFDIGNNNGVVQWANGKVPASTPPAQKASKPNIFWFNTDDQEILLGSIGAMPQLKEHIIEKGTVLRNYYTNTPICCPSRTAALSGRFFHNQREATPAKGGCMHTTIKELDENGLPAWNNNTVQRWLSAAGYRTGFFGKHHHMKGERMCAQADGSTNGTLWTPPGWDEFYAFCHIAYYECEWVHNGKWFATGSNPEDYSTSLIGNATMAWLKKVVGGPAPVFANIQPHAPHAPSTPAPWYMNCSAAKSNPHTLRTPNWNWTDDAATTCGVAGVMNTSCGHHWQVKVQPPLDETDVNDIDKWYQDIQCALMSVDDIVGEVVALLTERKQLDNSYFLCVCELSYTSDHGISMGQFRIPCVKRQLYESNTRIPGFIKGPGVPAGATRYELVSHVDTVPTILGLAGVSTPDMMDGRNIAPYLMNTTTDAMAAAGAWKNETILDPGHIKSTRNNTWIAIRVLQLDANGQPKANNNPAALRQNLVYAEYTDVLDDWNFTCGPNNYTRWMQGDRDNAGSNLQAEQYDTKRVRKHVNDQCPGIVNMTSAGKTNGNKVSPALNLSTLAACCDACSKASNCKWFAFTPPGSVKKGDTCWLFKTITSLGKKGKGNFTLFNKVNSNDLSIYVCDCSTKTHGN